MPEIKPCPFCGAVPQYSESTNFNGDADSLKWGALVCQECCSQGPHVRTQYKTFEHWRDEAITEWNKRA